MAPSFRPPWERGHLPVCQQGHGGPPHPARKRHAQQWGMGGKEGILSAQQAVPAHQDPQLSCRTSPTMLSQCLPQQGPSTYPLSRHSRGASITLGTLCAIPAWVPRVPLPGKGTVVRGYWCWTKPAPEYTVLVLCGLGVG